MDAADVPLPVYPEIVVSGKQISADDLADHGRQSPQKDQHRRIKFSVKFESRTCEQVGIVLNTADLERAGAYLVLEHRDEGCGRLGSNQPFDQRIAITSIVADDAHQPGLDPSRFAGPNPNGIRAPIE